MATKTKKTTAKTTTKKSETIKQIENIEKVLESVKKDDIVNLVPEDIKDEVKADIEASEEFGQPENIDVEKEVNDFIENAEPSEELKEQFREIEKSQAELNEKIAKEPEKAEEIVKEEIKKMEAIKKKAEAMKTNIQKTQDRNIRNEGFTNWWNGSSSLY